MRKHRAKPRTIEQVGLAILILASPVIAYSIGVDAGETAPVDLRVVYEESGEPYSITVLRDGETVRTERVIEGWRGNNEAENGLYTYDPASGRD